MLLCNSRRCLFESRRFADVRRRQRFIDSLRPCQTGRFSREICRLCVSPSVDILRLGRQGAGRPAGRLAEALAAGKRDVILSVVAGAFYGALYQRFMCVRSVSLGVC